MGIPETLQVVGVGANPPHQAVPEIPALPLSWLPMHVPTHPRVHHCRSPAGGHCGGISGAAAARAGSVQLQAGGSPGRPQTCRWSVPSLNDCRRRCSAGIQRTRLVKCRGSAPFAVGLSYWHSFLCASLILVSKVADGLKEKLYALRRPNLCNLKPQNLKKNQRLQIDEKMGEKLPGGELCVVS